MHLPLRRARASQSFRDELGEVKSRLKTARFGFPGKPGLEAKTKSRDEIFMSRLGANKTLTQWAAEGSGLWAKQVPAGPRGGGQPSGRPGYLKAYEYFFMQSIPLGKWSISCYISKQGCHSHPWFQPSKCEFLSPKSTQEEQYLQSSSCSLWVSTEGKCRILAPDCWDAYEGNDFSEPRLLHIFIHRKELNSLIWCSLFSVIHKKYFWCLDYLPFVAIFCIMWPPLHILWTILLGLLEMLSPGLEVLKNSSRIKHNSQFLGCDHVLSQHIFIMCQILSRVGKIARNASDRNPCPGGVCMLAGMDRQADN